jgi:hypothetical protein
MSSIGKIKLRLGCKCEPECVEDDLMLVCTGDGVHHEYKCPTCGGRLMFVVEPLSGARWEG